MDVLVKIGQLLLSLSILVILHELGHFLPAKWFKTKVEKFYLFFDFAPFNALWKTQKGETEYGIGWLPLGGYVKIAGMVDESMDTEALKEPPKPWEFRSKPAWQRLIIMIGGVTVNFLLGILIFGLMKWYWGDPFVPNSELKYGIQMDSVLIRQGFQHGDVITKIGDKPIDRLDPVGLIEQVSLNGVRTATVLREGQPVILNFTDPEISQKLTSYAQSKRMLMQVRAPFEIGEVVHPKPSIWKRLFGGNDTEDTRPPAAKAGLQKGDKIIGVDGAETPFYDQFMHVANQSLGKTVQLAVLRMTDTVKRSYDTLRLPLTFEKDKATIGVMRAAGNFYKVSREKVSFAQAIPSGYEESVDFLKTQLKAFGKMFSGELKVQDNLGSLISIGNMFPGTWDWESFWRLTASLSIILAFMNLLPIPALDGGYVVFLLWEVVTRRRVSDGFMEKAVTLGFFLLLGLMVFAFGLDIWRNFIR